VTKFRLDIIHQEKRQQHFVNPTTTMLGKVIVGTRWPTIEVAQSRSKKKCKNKKDQNPSIWENRK
jgi:hypothetical protein